MDAKGPCRIINAPNPIREKAIKGSGIDLETIQKRVEKAFEDLKGEYVTQVRKDLVTIDAALETARRAAETERSEALRRIHQVSHDIRGQAGTFGYPLITTIGSSLCNMSMQAAETGPALLTAVEIHIDAMKAVIAQGISGQGGITGRELVQDMNKLVAKTLGK